MAPPEIAAQFALEVNAEEICLTKLNLKIPFGVHGLGKYVSPDFLRWLIERENKEMAFINQKTSADSTQMPLVTVVTIVKDIVKNGRVDYLAQCIESVQRQTYSNIEHLIIDGASEDGTQDILEKYKDVSSIKVYSSPDDGIWDAMNKGISLATGVFVNFLNSDDYFCDENAVQIAVNSITKSNADWFYSDASIIRQDGSQYAFPTSLYGVFSCMGIVHQTMFVKHKLLLRSAAFTSPYKTKENYLMMLLIMNGFKPVYHPSPLVHYREGGYSLHAYGGDRLEETKQDFAEYFYLLAGRRWGLSKADCCEMFGWQLFQYERIEIQRISGSEIRTN